MEAKKNVKEKVVLNHRGMKKAHKKIYRAFKKYKLNLVEAYIITKTVMEDIEKDAEKHDFDMPKAYLDLKRQLEEKANKNKIAVKGI